MTAAVRRIADQAAALAPSERAELVQAILASFSAPDASVDAAWRAEAASRLDAWRKGEITDESADDVRRRVDRGRP